MWKQLVRLILTVAVVATVLESAALANVFHMGGTRNPDGTWTGLASLETVVVGNSGNAGEPCGTSVGGNGPDAVVGAVGYEYEIGKYEITAGQYCEFLNAVAKTDTFKLYSSSMWSSTWGCKIQRGGSWGNLTYSVAPDRANRPVNFISWGDAARFVNWLHNGQPTGAQALSTTEDGSYFLDGATTQAELMAVRRQRSATWVLPSEDEWHKAAYHKNDGATSNYFDYPMGSDDLPSNDLVDLDPGNNGNFGQNGFTLNGPYYTTEVGEFENSESPYGTFDQGGNVFEFNESESSTGRFRRKCGGNWEYGSEYLHAINRYAADPTGEVHAVGFRVACVPEPGAAVLWAGIAVAMSLCHRRGQACIPEKLEELGDAMHNS